MNKILIAIALATSITASAYAADSYTIDPNHTFPVFEVSHLGYTMQHGRFNKTNGSITLDMAAKSGSVDLVIVDALADPVSESEFGFVICNFLLRIDRTGRIDSILNALVQTLCAELAAIRWCQYNYVFDVDSELGGQHQLIAFALRKLTELSFRGAKTVHSGHVEVTYASIICRMQYALAMFRRGDAH